MTVYLVSSEFKMDNGYFHNFVREPELFLKKRDAEKEYWLQTKMIKEELGDIRAENDLNKQIWDNRGTLKFVLWKDKKHNLRAYVKMRECEVK